MSSIGSCFFSPPNWHVYCIHFVGGGVGDAFDKMLALSIPCVKQSLLTPTSHLDTRSAPTHTQDASHHQDARHVLSFRDPFTIYHWEGEHPNILHNIRYVILYDIIYVMSYYVILYDDYKLNM